MPKQKISMPDDIYGGPTGGAIDKLTGGATGPQKPPAQPPGAQAQTTPAKLANKEQREVKPISIYLSSEQQRRLDDLAYLFNARTGQRINRNDIIRHWVDTLDIGSLEGISRHKPGRKAD